MQDRVKRELEVLWTIFCEATSVTAKHRVSRMRLRMDHPRMRDKWCVVSRPHSEL